MDELRHRWALAPYTEVLHHENSLIVGFGSVGIRFDVREQIDAAFHIFSYLDNDRLFRSDFSLSNLTALQLSIFERLIGNRLIVDASTIPTRNRYHRDGLFYLLKGGIPTDVIRRLKSKSVCVIGVGGIGSLVSLTLACSGVGKQYIIDDDIVEIHNLTRQFMFTEDDIGCSKVQCIQREILRRNSDVEVSVLEERVSFADDANNLPDADLFVLAADEKGIVERANRYFVESKKPFVHICYINDIAAWGPFVIPGQSGCWGCADHIGVSKFGDDCERSRIIEEINGGYTCPIISPVSLTASALASLDIISFLGEFGDVQSVNRRIGLWTHSLEVERQEYNRSMSCKVCSHLA